VAANTLKATSAQKIITNKIRAEPRLFSDIVIEEKPIDLQDFNQ
jgi:hypothetical protein